MLLLHAVDSDVGQGRKQELSGAILASHPATIGPLSQGADSLVQFSHGRLTVLGMPGFEVISNVLQIRCGGWRPAVRIL